MNIAVLSDLHVDTNGYDRVLDCLARELDARRADTLLLAGDISSHCETTLSFLDDLRDRSGLPVLWVPGNHDLWNKRCPELDAPAILGCYRADEGFVSGRRPLAPGWSLVADMGWYDYSFGDSAFDYDTLQLRTHMGRTWQDSLYAKFSCGDAEVHDRSMRTLRTALAQAGERIVLMTHTVSHRRYTVPKLDDYPEWLYFNAFLGSEELCALARETPHIDYVICGHVHHRGRFAEHGREYLCCCLGYKSEWKHFGHTELGDALGAAMQVIEL